jgi:hypothetical protein
MLLNTPAYAHHCLLTIDIDEEKNVDNEKGDKQSLYDFLVCLSIEKSEYTHLSFMSLTRLLCCSSTMAYANSFCVYTQHKARGITATHQRIFTSK